MSVITHTLHVDLDDRSYPIYIGSDLLGDAQLLRRHIAASQVMVVTNETIAPLYLDKLLNGLQGLQVDHVVLPDGERFKNLDTLERIFDRLLQQKHNRTTTLLALGGGVVGDMCGFAAASYQRGVDFIQVPTTLLAQVDSSVGGKTGVNHALGKNMIGAFHQPRSVYIDTTTLHTLPKREFAAGLAEVIKYGLIADVEFYGWLEEHIGGLVEGDERLLAEAIERSCATKAAVVAADEREGGIRAILNLGHTFGHAIETAQGYAELLHGEAVAIGMVLALRVSAALGDIETVEVGRLQTLLQRAGLPTEIPDGIDSDTFLQLMSLDKKVLDGRIRLVLLDRIGSARVTSDIPRELLIDILSGNE